MLLSWAVIVGALAVLAAMMAPRGDLPEAVEPPAVRSGLSLLAIAAAVGAFFTLGFSSGAMERGVVELVPWVGLAAGLALMSGVVDERLSARIGQSAPAITRSVGTALGGIAAWFLLEDITLDVHRGITEAMKIGLAACGMALALAWSVLPRRFATNALVLLTMVGSLNYARWGPESFTQRLDAYDVLHYYVNAKYFDELGYYDLYPAMMLADLENDGPFFDGGPVYMAQDAEGHAKHPIRHAFDRGRVVKREKFTEERWADFTHDVLYLVREVGCRNKDEKGVCRAELNDKLWRQLIQDHGFNGTTVWTMIAAPITKVVPIEYLKLLGYIDVVLLLGAVFMVAWAYDGTAALFTALWLLVGYSSRWPYLSWVFLRYDWLAALIMATALLKKGKPFLAGFLAGWSATLRFFPALWMWGPFGKGVAGLMRRTVHKPLLVLAGGFLVAVAVLQGAAVVTYGVEPHRVHFENMLDHNDPMQLSSRRIGLAQAISQQDKGRLHKFITTRQKRIINEQKPLRYGLGLGVMLLLAWGLRRSRDDEAFAFGFLPFFLLTTASYYYYAARVTMAVVHAGDLRRWRNRAGLGTLFALELFSNFAAVVEGNMRMVLIGNLAQGFAMYTVLVVLALNWEATQGGTEDDESDDASSDDTGPTPAPEPSAEGVA